MRGRECAIDIGITLGVIKCTPPPGTRVEVLPLSGDGIFRMRNLAANSILRNPDFQWVTHLLFIDSDILFTPQDVWALVESGRDLISGCYPKRQKNLEYVANLYPGDTLMLNTGPMRAACVGTGFLLISRRCFMAITQVLPRIGTGPRVQNDRYAPIWTALDWWFLPDDGARVWWFDFFPMFALPDPDCGWTRQLSEDWIFSKLALLAGIQPFIHSNVVLKHYGETIYG